MTKIFVYRTWPKGPNRQSPVVARIVGKSLEACEALARSKFDPSNHGWHETTDGLEVIESEIEVLSG
jgi:hypothetical protein